MNPLKGKLQVNVFCCWKERKRDWTALDWTVSVYRRLRSDAKRAKVAAIGGIGTCWLNARVRVGVVTL